MYDNTRSQLYSDSYFVYREVLNYLALSACGEVSETPGHCVRSLMKVAVKVTLNL
jgi:hypothetical protein